MNNIIHNVRNLTQPQKLIQEVRVVPHFSLIYFNVRLLLINVRLELFSTHMLTPDTFWA